MKVTYTKRKSFNFDPDSPDPFRISRSKIDSFIECPRCFYMDQCLGIRRPSTPPFSLNIAVDALLKKEFDTHRVAATTHPLLKKYGVDAVPFAHKNLELWRDSLRNGISFLHEPTNLIIRGGIDDVWQNKEGELIIVDYKATAKETEVNLDAEWQIVYKRQMEIYQWLFRKNGFKVSDTGYFVYVNGKTDREAFDGKLEFDVNLISYTGKDDWIEKVIFKIKECLMGDLPKAPSDCEYCGYRKASAEVAAEFMKKGKK